MRLRFNKAALGVLVVAAIAVTACGGDDQGADGGSDATVTEQQGEPSQDGASAGDDGAPSGATSQTAATGPGTGTGETAAPVSGGSLNYVVYAEGAGLDPVQVLNMSARNITGSAAYAIYDTLLRFDDKLNIELGTAESVEPNDDATSWTIKLRPGITFTDGTPYDAAAVKYNFERHADPERLSSAIGEAQLITSMEVVDPLTLRVDLTGPQPLWDQRIAFTSMILVGSPTAMEELGDDFANAPVGAGPFVLSEYVRGSDIKLERNPDYWNAPLPYIDELTFTLLPDESQALNMMTTGAAQLMIPISGLNMSQAESQGLTAFTNNVTQGGGSLAFNHTRPPFDDVRVRRALWLGIDKQQLIDVAFGGVGTPADSLFLESSPYWSEDLKFPDYDPDEAQRLFSEYAQETGGPVTFSFMSASVANERNEQILTQLLQYDDVDVTYEAVGSVENAERGRARDFDMTSTGFAFLTPVPGLSQEMATGGPGNYAGYSNPQVDEWLQRAEVTPDEDERIDLYRKVQQAFIDDAVELIFLRNEIYHYAAADVQDLEFFGDGVPRWDVVWLEH